MQSNQDRADKECRRICREAARDGRTVPFTLARMIDAKVPVKTIKKVIR